MQRHGRCGIAGERDVRFEREIGRLSNRFSDRLGSMRDTGGGPANNGQRKSLFRRPPTSAGATVDARKPSICSCRSEQASIAVAAVGVLAELTRAPRRHCTGLHRQARCFAQQVGPSRGVHCRRTAHEAWRDLDRAEIAGAVRSLRSHDGRGFVCGVLARNFAKQPFQYFDHYCAPVIDLATMHRIRRSWQTTREHCDGCLTARRCKLNGVSNSLVILGISMGLRPNYVVFPLRKYR
jgi:hypothetical protein